MVRLSAIAAILLCLTGQQRADPSLADTSFTIDAPSEAVAVVRASCARCDWGVTGREAAAVRILVDGNYSQHLMLYRGAEQSEYRLTLGHLNAGAHRLRVEADPSLSAHDAGTPVIAGLTVTSASSTGLDAVKQAHAPILYARPNTVGRFTDLPVLMWVEDVPSP